MGNRQGLKICEIPHVIKEKREGGRVPTCQHLINEINENKQPKRCSETRLFLLFYMKIHMISSRNKVTHHERGKEKKRICSVPSVLFFLERSMVIELALFRLGNFLAPLLKFQKTASRPPPCLKD
jgi:hypothetical protein